MSADGSPNELATFRAMGCDVLVSGATDEELAAVEALFEERDARFSRFRDTSELARVNRSPSPVVRVSELFARMVRRALDAARATGGIVDPTVGRAVESAGYDRDFSSLGPDARPAGPAATGRLRDVRLWGRTIARPIGVQLDLNGVVKSVTVDDAAQLISGAGFVSAGGDVAATAPTLVALPDGDAVRLVSGGIATSGTVRRRWLRGGELQHHLIDPRTGRPSRSRWHQVTVAARSCVAADVAAKAAFLLDVDGPAWLDARGLPGRFLGEHGEIVLTGSWARALARAHDARAAVQGP